MNANFNIEKLDDTNYSSWCVQMKNVLIFQELWEIASGGTSKPKGSSKQEEISEWVQKDQKAKALIILNVKACQINYVKKCATSYETWNVLESFHRPTGPVRKVTLFKQLINLKMREDEDIQKFISKFTDNLEKLEEIGVRVQEELFIIMLLASLPKNYENLVVALESRDDLPTLSSLKIKLIEEGERQKAYDMHIVENSLQSTSIKNNETTQNYNIKNNYKVSKNNNNNRFKKVQNYKCYNCGQKGHLAANCYKRNKKREECKNDHSNYSIITKGEINFNLNTNNCNTTVWCLDSGATSHMCNDLNMFIKIEEYVEIINLAGNNNIKTQGRGEIILKTDFTKIILNNVLYVPELQCNFISVAKVVENKKVIEFKTNHALIKDSSGKVELKANRIENLFICEIIKEKLCMAQENSKIVKWHQRYGHLNFKDLYEISKNKMVHGLEISAVQENNCIVCLKGKITTKPFESSKNRSTDLLEIIHTDVCGPINVTSSGGNKYILTFIDDLSRYVHIYLLKSKDEAFQYFKEFKEMVENQTKVKIKYLRSDNGLEFVNNAFDNYLKQCGIQRQLSVPYTPQQNGVAERMNRTIVEMARCMLLQSGLEEHHWGEAVKTAAYIRNRSPTHVLINKTPYEIWTGRKPVVSHFKTFGCLAIALDKTQNKKFREKGKECWMVGYAEQSKAYRLYEKSTGKIILSRDVYFIENFNDENKNDNNYKEMLVVKDDMDTGCEEVKDVNNENNVQVEVNDDVAKTKPGRPKIIRSGRAGRPRKEYNMLSTLKDVDVKVPNSVESALNGKYGEKWRESMKCEYLSLLKNNTWTLTELPNNEKVIGCRWVFAVKKDENGSVERLKSRLVAKGCNQEYGINFKETYSPVVRYATIRMVIALAAEYELYLHQLDVSAAYLNSDLKDVIYMKQPEGFIDEKFPNHVLKLNKSIYGLKQSGREWNQKIDSILKKFDLKPCASEPCLYTKSMGSKIIIVAIYVDDMIIACSEKSDLIELKEKISSEVEITDKGDIKNFLGMEVNRNGEKGQITISQRRFIEELLKKYDLQKCRQVATPLDPGFQVQCDNDQCKKVDQVEYQSLIGSLMYLAVLTRPDILHSVSKLSQRNKDPHIEHFTAAKHVLRYLQKTIDLKLRFFRTTLGLQCYADADWGGDTTDRKSFTGYVFLLAGGAISWESKKQSSVALSTTEAEYMALALAAKEAIYLRKLFNELNLSSEYETIVINGDNLSAQQLVKNPMYHNRSKHIDIKYHFIREKYNNNEIDLNYISTNDMIADILTKNLKNVIHSKFVKSLGLICEG